MEDYPVYFKDKGQACLVVKGPAKIQSDHKPSSETSDARVEVMGLPRDGSCIEILEFLLKFTARISVSELGLKRITLLPPEGAIVDFIDVEAARRAETSCNGKVLRAKEAPPGVGHSQPKISCKAIQRPPELRSKPESDIHSAYTEVVVDVKDSRAGQVSKVRKKSNGSSCCIIM